MTGCRGRTPDRIRRLLSRAAWHMVAAMGEVPRFAVAGLQEAAWRAGCRASLVTGPLDETGQLKNDVGSWPSTSAQRFP
jgi:hypothetical protein